MVCVIMKNANFYFDVTDKITICAIQFSTQHSKIILFKIHNCIAECASKLVLITLMSNSLRRVKLSELQMHDFKLLCSVNAVVFILLI